jgi:hypothetical protein
MALIPAVRALFKGSMLRDIKRNRQGGIARGSRREFNRLMNEQFGRVNGRMTWAQLADAYPERVGALADELGDEDMDE